MNLLSHLKKIRAYSQETYNHSLNVAWISRSLACVMGVNDKEATRYYLAGLFHDIGKTFIPKEILFLPRKLEQDEWKIVQDHVIAGANYLLKHGLENEADAALLHHERADGSGYPEGRTLEQIPILVRVIAVADSLSAMIEHRPYRKAKTWSIAVNELINTDNLYDPSVLEALSVMAEQIHKTKQHNISSIH